MNSTFKTISFVIACAALTQLRAADESKPKLDREAQIKEKVDAFKKSGGVAPIEDLLSAEQMLDMQLTGFQVLNLELQILEAAMSREDKSMTAKNHPRAAISVSSPSVFSGTDASAIKDPVERAAYQKRIRENEVIAKKINEQAAIEIIKSNVFGYLRTSIKHLDKSPEDQKAQQQIINFLKTSSLSVEIKAEILKLVTPPEPKKQQR